MMKAIKIIVLICTLIIVIMGRGIDGKAEAQEKAGKNCAFGSGFEFCASIDAPSKVDVMLYTSLRNVSDKTVTLSIFDDIYQRYTIIITAPSGETLLSKKECEAKKARENPGSDIVAPTVSFRGPATKELAPNEVFNVEYGLSSIYQFSSKGKYRIEISRRLPADKDKDNSTEIKLEPIEIELK